MSLELEHFLKAGGNEVYSKYAEHAAFAPI